MASRISLKELDWLTVATVLLITTIGISFIWSTSYSPDRGGERSLMEEPAVKQLVWTAVAVFLSIILLGFSYLRLGKYAYIIYIIGIVCLVITLSSAPRRKARRWIHVGPFTVQPSEFVKLAMVIALAQYLRYKDARSAQTIVFALPIIGLPVLLVLKQPDLGTALTMIPIGAAMLFVAGMRIKHAAVIAAAGLLLLPIAWFNLKGYQQDRLSAFIRPEESRLNDGYQVIQSVVAIGSGGTFGKGLGRGQVHVPETTTDFVFAAIGEEWGFAGCTLILALFMLMFASSSGIAVRTRESFGRLLVVGCTATIAVQVFVNSGMTIQLMPITGLTLPMVSYGGSSLVTSYAAVAIILNVGMRRVDVFAGA